MLIDDVTIKVKAGNGGRGSVAFNNIKMNLGPTGADGGNGGDIYFEGVSDLGTLSQFRYKKRLAAENGENGKKQFNDGTNGKDLILKIPIGTVVYNLSSGKNLEIMEIGQRLLIAKGGRGGKGNFKFRSSTNTSPTEFQEGAPGEEYKLRLELKLIADIGFIGLPNVGKSSLLNELTDAKSKVANYLFTTLEPNLGVYYELILADIPGLIEGASNGKGLGIKFLRHIKRTKMLAHLVSFENGEEMISVYKKIRKELEKYDPVKSLRDHGAGPSLTEKDELIILTKTDVTDEETIKKIIKEFKKLKKPIFTISLYDDASIKTFSDLLIKILKSHT